MADSLIKPDPDAPGASPGAFTDEDIYEDAGDLEFNTDPKYQRLYLVRMPKYVWEQWSKLDDDAEIQLGTIRQVTQTEPNGDKRESLHMLLRSDLAQHQGVPKEYTLDVVSQAVQNTFVFTEQDLPGFKSRSRNKFDSLNANMPLRPNRSKVEKPTEKQPWDKNRRYQPYYRRAIPKKTTLVGKVAHEVNCIPVENEESRQILARRTIEAMKPKTGTRFIKGDASNMVNGFIQAGTVRAQDAFRDFIKDTGAARSKATAQDTKTARIPQNELLDRIFACFRRFNYWSMKALRAELHQPEVYIRETLDKVAEMPKSGRFAMHWTLKPEFKNATYAGADDGSAPVTAGGVEGVDDSDEGDLDGEDDDDDDVKMEDVLP